MSRIDVECRVVIDGWQCRVRVTDQQGTAEHNVGIGELGSFLSSVLPYPGFDDMERLVQTTFEFLLERQPRDAIPPRFDLNDVEVQFPDYRRVTRIKLSRPLSGH